MEQKKNYAFEEKILLHMTASTEKEERETFVQNDLSFDKDSSRQGYEKQRCSSGHSYFHRVKTNVPYHYQHVMIKGNISE